MATLDQLLRRLLESYYAKATLSGDHEQQKQILELHAAVEKALELTELSRNETDGEHRSILAL